MCHRGGRRPERDRRGGRACAFTGMSSSSTIPGLVLAGGASRRMGTDGPKADSLLDNRTLLQHVLHRLRPQVGALWLSLSPRAPAPETDDVEVLRDPQPSHRGPLAGLAAGLERLARDGGDWLVMAPCDTPFLPKDLVTALLAARGPGVLAVAAADEDRVHPTCSLWRVDCAPVVSEALADDAGPGLMALLGRVEHRVQRWTSLAPPPFFNVNTPEDLVTAGRWLGTRHDHA